MRSLCILLLVAASALPSPAAVTCKETDASISVTVAGKPVLVYHKAIVDPPAGIDSVYRRSSYIHPVFTPEGREVTGDFPADHPHQHALFFAWRKVKFEGRETNFWEQKNLYGRTTHDKVLSLKNGETSGSFKVQHLHEDLTAGGPPKPIIRETWTITIHDRGDKPPLFDLELVQTNIADSPITIEQYHYGGMAIRGPDSWLLDAESANALKAWIAARKKDPKAPRPEFTRPGDFLTSEGLNAKDGNHSRPNWVDMHGGEGPTAAGIAVFSHPSNFRHPQPVRLHPNKPYFSYSPMVLGEFKIQPGATYTARYRYLPHDGAPDPALLEAEYQAFATE